MGSTSNWHKYLVKENIAQNDFLSFCICKVNVQELKCERNYLNKCRFFRKSVTFHIKMKFWLGYNLPYPHITQDATQWRATETPENWLLMTDIEDSIWAPRGDTKAWECIPWVSPMFGWHGLSAWCAYWKSRSDLTILPVQGRARLICELGYISWCQSKPYGSIHSCAQQAQ